MNESPPSRLLRHVAGAVARVWPSRHGLVLCYHGVEARPPRLPASPHVSFQQFSDTLDVARSLGQAVPLRELLDRETAGRSTAGLFSVTVDDAYASMAQRL